MNRLGLGITCLEDRLTPAYFMWDPVQGDGSPAPFGGNWSSVRNWKEQAAVGYEHTDRAVPGVGDNAIFPSTSNSACYVDTPVTVATVEYRAPRYLHLLSPLTVTNTFTLAGEGGVEGRSEFDNTPYAGYLNVAPGATFTWDYGELWGASVYVQSDQTKFATMDVEQFGGANLTYTHRMNGASIQVSGRLNWESADVHVYGAIASQITISQGGKFDITAPNTWGVIGPADGHAEFTVYNYGTVTVTSPGVSALNGAYITYSSTQVNSGTFLIDGIAKQRSGVFGLATGTTVKVLGEEQALRIQDGGIVGDGTIDANLTLGYDPATNPNSSSTPYIFPRVLTAAATPAPGKLAVTQSFQIFTSSANSYFVTDAGGNYSKIVVSGTATLKGNLNVTRDPAYTPERGVELPIITAAGGLGGSNFDNVRIDTMFGGLWTGAPDAQHNDYSTRRYFVGRARATTFVLKVVRPGQDTYTP